MDLEFSEEEKLWQGAVSNYAEREIAPQDLMTLDHIPRKILKKMGDLGFLSLRVPEEYGGNPATWVMMGILAEEIAKTSIAFAYSIMISYEVSLPLATYGIDQVKDEWLPGLIKGDHLGCVALAEHMGGTDINGTGTIAMRDQDAYFINGEKTPVSFATQADVVLLFVKTNSEIGIRDLTALLIPLGLSGIAKSEIKTMGLLPSAPCSVTFDDVKVQARYRIGKEGEGFPIHTEMGLSSDFNQILSGLICLGAAQTAMRFAVSYSKERFTFGRPIAKFGAISAKIAENATLIEAARWLCYRALALKDQGVSNRKEAAMCGWWCPKVAYQAIKDSLLIHGHAGYCDDHPFQQMLRDIVAFEMISGTENSLKLIVGHETIGSAAVPDILSNQFVNYVAECSLRLL
jgi:cyclohexanecarboxyl-CoA dehydrogenase